MKKNIQETITHIIELEGESIVKDPSRLCNMIEDISPYLKDEKEFLYKILTYSVGRELCEALLTKDSQSNEHILEARRILVNEEGRNDSCADKIFEYFGISISICDSKTNIKCRSFKKTNRKDIQINGKFINHKKDKEGACIYVYKEPNLFLFVFAVLLQISSLYIVAQNEFLVYGTGLLSNTFDIGILSSILLFLFIVLFVNSDWKLRTAIILLLVQFLLFVLNHENNSIIMIFCILSLVSISEEDTSIRHSLLFSQMLVIIEVCFIKSLGIARLVYLYPLIPIRFLWVVLLIEYISLLYVIFYLKFNRFYQRYNVISYSSYNIEKGYVISDDWPMSVSSSMCIGFIVTFILGIVVVVIRIFNKEWLRRIADMKLILVSICFLIVVFAVWVFVDIPEYKKIDNKWKIVDKKKSN